MLTPAMGQQPPAGQPWAADTGCYANPASHNDEKYLAWLGRMPTATCMFATAPDVFGDGPATLELARPMLPRIRAAGVPAALVAQPGTTPDAVPWADVDVLFIGGPNTWQHSEACLEVVMEARRRGLLVHVGRVNGWARLRWARSIGASSADGTYLRYGPDKNSAQMAAWLQRLEDNPVISWPVATPATR
jgi:hypothetical protein